MNNSMNLNFVSLSPLLLPFFFIKKKAIEVDNQFHKKLAFSTHRKYQYVVDHIFLKKKKKVALQNYSTIYKSNTWSTISVTGKQGGKPNL